jgi:hypothetical protein
MKYFLIFLCGILKLQILFLFFYRLTHFNPCNQGPHLLARSTLEPDLIIMVKIVFYFNYNFKNILFINIHNNFI